MPPIYLYSKALSIHLKYIHHFTCFRIKTCACIFICASFDCHIYELYSLFLIFPGKPSVRTFVETHIKKVGLDGMLEIVEGGGEASLGLRQHPVPAFHEGQPPLKEVNVFLEVHFTSVVIVLYEEIVTLCDFIEK